MRTLHASVILGALLLVAACDAAPEEEQADQPPPQPAAETTAQAPDTTVEALWRHLQDEGYRQNWSLWPGKGELYAGTEPHGMLLTTYVNEAGRRALPQGVENLPAGAIIVKENYMPDSTFAAATVMYKVDGYNPEHANWLFAKYDSTGAAEAFGRAEGCTSCHQAAESGYVYTPVGG